MSSCSCFYQWILAFLCHPSFLSRHCRTPFQSLLDWLTRICVECCHVTSAEQQRVMWLRPDDLHPQALSILFIHWLNWEAKVIDVRSSRRVAGTVWVTSQRAHKQSCVLHFIESNHKKNWAAPVSGFISSYLAQFLLPWVSDQPHCL